MTHSSPLTWVEWLDPQWFLSSDAGGGVHLHHWDLAKLTEKIHRGRYEDKEKPKREFNDHSPFGVYQVQTDLFIHGLGMNYSQVRVKPGSGEVFATCSVDTTALVWTTAEEKRPLVSKLSGHLGYVTGLEWLPSTDRLITASWDHTIKESFYLIVDLKSDLSFTLLKIILNYNCRSGTALRGLSCRAWSITKTQ